MHQASQDMVSQPPKDPAVEGQTMTLGQLHEEHLGLSPVPIIPVSVPFSLSFLLLLHLSLSPTFLPRLSLPVLSLGSLVTLTGFI